MGCVLIPLLRQLKRRLAELESEKEEYVPPLSLQDCFALSCHGASNEIMTGGAHFYADMA